MAFSDPRTWVTGELVTANLMNTHLRDQLDAIVEGTTGAYVNAVTGPHAIGGSTVDYVRLGLTGAFTSGGASTVAFGLYTSGVLTGHSGDSAAIAGIKANNSIVTAGNCTTVAQLWVSEPQITVGAGAVTNSATVYIEGAASEASNDYALWVDAGATKLDGTVTTGSTLTVGTDLTVTEDIVVSAAGPHAIGGSVVDYVRLGLTGAFTSGGASTVAFGTYMSGALTGHSADSAAIAGTKLNNSIVTAGNCTTIAQLWVSEPQITVGAGSVTNSATVYIEGAASEATNDYALWVDAGATQLDGTLDVAGHTALDSTLSIGYGSIDNYQQVFIGGTLASGGASSHAEAMVVQTAITGATGDTGWLAGVKIGPSITTQASETIVHATSLIVNEPEITKGSGATVTTASTLWIANQPTEGARNAGLVATGVVINEESPAITATVQSNKAVGVYVGGQSNDEASVAVVSLTDDIAGTSRAWSLVNGRTDSAQTVGTLNFLAATANSQDPLDGAVTVMSLDDNGDADVAGTIFASKHYTAVSTAISTDGTTNLYASAGASGSGGGMIAMRDGYGRFGLFWYGSYDTLTKLAGNSVYSATKDNASTINIYYESGNIVYQNKTAIASLSVHYTRILD